MKDWGSNAVLWLQGSGAPVLEIKNAVVVIFLIFLNHNGLWSRVKSSSQLRQADSISGQLTAFTIYGPHRKYYMIKSFKHRAKKKKTDKLANSNNFNTEESIMCTDFRVCIMSLAYTLRSWSQLCMQFVNACTRTFYFAAKQDLDASFL